MSILTTLRRPAVHIRMIFGLLLFTLCIAMLYGHAVAVREMRDTGIPAAMALPALQKRASLLEEQNDMVTLQAMLRGNAQRELFHLYVLPEKEELEPLLALFDSFTALLQKQKLLRSFSALQPLEPGEITISGSTLRTYPFTMEAEFTEEGLRQMLLLTELAGTVTVSDMLSPADIERLLMLTEEESPTAVTALEYFLSTDLLRYCEEQKAYDAELRKSFSVQTYEEHLLPLLQETRLPEAVRLLSTLAPILREQHLWPMRFLEVSHLAIQPLPDEWLHVAMTFRALSRTQE